MDDAKRVQFRLDDDELARVDKVKPIDVSRSGFMKEMAFVGIESTISDAENRRNNEKKFIKELKEQSRDQQIALNNLASIIRDLDRRIDGVPQSVLNQIIMGLVVQMKPVIEGLAGLAVEKTLGREQPGGWKPKEKSEVCENQAPIHRQPLKDREYEILVSRVSAISDLLVKLTELGVFRQYVDASELLKIQGKMTEG